MKSIMACGVSVDFSVSRAMVNPLYFDVMTEEYLMEPLVGMMLESSEAKTVNVVREISVTSMKERHVAFLRVMIFKLLCLPSIRCRTI